MCRCFFGGGGGGTTHDEINVAVLSNLQRYLASKVFFRFISRIPFSLSRILFIRIFRMDFFHLWRLVIETLLLINYLDTINCYCLYTVLLPDS